MFELMKTQLLSFETCYMHCCRCVIQLQDNACSAMARTNGAAVTLPTFLVLSSSCLQYTSSIEYGLQCNSFLSRCGAIVHLSSVEVWCLATQVGFVKACSLLVLYALFVVLVLAADIHHRIR